MTQGKSSWGMRIAEDRKISQYDSFMSLMFNLLSKIYQ